MVDISGGVTFHANGDSGPTGAQGAGGSSSRGSDSATETAVGYVSTSSTQNLMTAQNLLGNANVLAFLHAITQAEGGSYNAINSGYHTSDLSHFPYSPTSSSAAGAYQILQSTYQGLSSELGLYDFSAKTQDEMGAFMLWRDGAAQALLKGDIQTAILKASSDWAALPMGPGSMDKSQYNQPFTHYQDFVNLYHSLGGH